MPNIGPGIPIGQNFVPGPLAGAAFQPLFSPNVVLGIRGYSLDLEAALFDVSNTGNVGGRSRLAGLDDAKGTVNTFLDFDLPLYNPPFVVRPAQRGVCTFGISLTAGIQVPVIVGKLHFQTTVDQALEASFDVAMDARSGLLVYPPTGA